MTSRSLLTTMVISCSIIEEEETKDENNEEKKHGHYLRREFSYSKFQQMLAFPDDVERE